MFRFTNRGLFLSILVVLACYSELVDARGRRVWTYKDLLAEAEVVCIVTVASTTKVANTEFNPDDLDRFESEAVVLVVLKGNAKLDKIKVVHFSYKPDLRFGPGNGPTFLAIGLPKEKDGSPSDDKRTAVKQPTQFLLFLRKRDDGAYGPVSGNRDAGISVAFVDGFTDDDH